MQVNLDQPIPRPDHPEVVIITGGTAGVGRAIAHEFARRGARIGLLARGTERLSATKREVQELGGEALEVPTDVADAAQVESAAAAVEDAFGPIDIWVNNAMTSVFGEIIDVEPDEYRRVTDVCYHGTVYGTMSALKRMIPRDKGIIVQVGSALAYRGIPLQAAYCGAKHAIQGMFESLRSELIHRNANIHLTMVHLPAMNTPQFGWVRSKLPRKAQPVPPIFQPELAARAVVWAAYHRRRELYLGWPATQVIVGNKIAPGIGDRYLAMTGYKDQMLDEAEDQDRPDNLFEPVPGDPGMRGSFDDRSKEDSIQYHLTINRRWIAVGAMAAAGVVAGWLGARN